MRMWALVSRKEQDTSQPSTSVTPRAVARTRAASRPARVSWSVRANALQPAAAANSAMRAGSSVPSDTSECVCRSITVWRGRPAAPPASGVPASTRRGHGASAGTAGSGSTVGDPTFGRGTSVRSGPARPRWHAPLPRWRVCWLSSVSGPAAPRPSAVGAALLCETAGDDRVRAILAARTPEQRGEQAETVKEACGVFGVYAPGRTVAQLTFDGIFALQHRGQESAGMAVSDGESNTVVKDMGLVTTVFDE